MAVYTPSNQHSGATVEAARVWRDRCLVADGSLFSDEVLWTAENFAALKQAFVDNPQLGTDPFYTKLARQLQEASPQVQRLAAECLWLLLLFVSSSGFNAATKRQRVEDVWRLSGEELPPSDLLGDIPMDGVGWPGTAFLTRIPDEYGYLVLTVLAWKQLPSSEQARLIASEDPWALCEWVTSQPGGDRRIFRHILLYLLSPETFERICSRKQKRDIYKAFKEHLSLEDLPAEPATPCELDRALLRIRRRLEEEHGTSEIDFYNDPLKDIWGFGASPGPAASRTDATSQSRRYWIEKTIVTGRADRESGENARDFWLLHAIVAAAGIVFAVAGKAFVARLLSSDQSH